MSGSKEFCEIEISFLQIQRIGTNVWFLEMHELHVDVVSSRSQQNQNLDTIHLQYCTMFEFTCVMNL